MKVISLKKDSSQNRIKYVEILPDNQINSSSKILTKGVFLT
jgi:hypothetical protein